MTDIDKARQLLNNMGVRLVQATEPEIYGRWDWIDDANGNASDMSFPTEEEAIEDFLQTSITDEPTP